MGTIGMELYGAELSLLYNPILSYLAFGCCGIAISFGHQGTLGGHRESEVALYHILAFEISVLARLPSRLSTG